MDTSRKYWSHIDGIRAIAVVAIVAYHIQPASVVSGYLGVDIFFVISGFLITQQILTRIEKDNFTLSDFFIRRIFRLFPALLATVLTTFLAGYFVLPPDHMARFSGAAVHSLFSVSNFYFLGESGYFDAASRLKPLLHTWSLSVEEQFYLVWPFLLLLVVRCLGVRSMIMTLILLATVSFLAAEYYSESSPSEVFYLMPFRLFEFAIGGLLVWIIDKKIPAVYQTGLLPIGILGVVCSIFFFDDSSVSQPVLILITCISTAILIYCGESWFGSLVLGNRFMTHLGRISYSLYLVHWPIIVLFGFSRPSGFSATDIISIVIATYLLALISFQYVEKPFRETSGTAVLSMKSRALTLIPLTSLLVVLASNSWANSGWPWRFVGQVALFDIEKIMDLDTHRDELVKYDLLNIKSSTYFSRVKPDQRKVLVIGDSHARDVAVSLSINLDPEKYEIRRLYLDDPCLVIFAGKEPIRGGLDACATQVENLQRSLMVKSANSIIFASFWWPDSIDGLKEAVGNVQKINPTAQIFVASRTEVFDNLPEQLMKHLVGGGSFSDASELANTLRQERTDLINAELEKIAQSAGVSFLDRTREICKENACIVFDPEGNLLFWDGHHYTMHAVRYLGKEFADDFTRLSKDAPNN